MGDGVGGERGGGGGGAGGGGAGSSSALSTESIRAYQVLCAFCGVALYRPPDADLLGALVAERSLLLREPFASVAPEAARALYEMLDVVPDGQPGGEQSDGSPGGEQSDGQPGGEQSGGVAPGGPPAAGPPGGSLDDLLKSVKQEHSFLFSMTGQSHASPYESVYRTDDQTMFGPSTLEVRAAYRAQGLQFPRAAREPDDHIGLEFMFVATLLERMCAARDADAQNESAPADEAAPAPATPTAPTAPATPTAPAPDEAALSAALSDFLADHLLVFAPTHFERLLAAQAEGFYPGCARIAQATLCSLAAALALAPRAADRNALGTGPLKDALPS
ncbi:MAG: molecular chaperone TorD family protein [Coriobacteriales bacterium]|jgi:TorA maturation chaperone TorD|nr:molecular chaperone TorD family protein [Coriobacteriales bacterium]